MTFVFDTETALISPGRCAPPMTCMSYDEGDGAKLSHWTEAYPVLRWHLERSDELFIGAYTAFDVLVTANQFPELLPLWFEAYRSDGVTDVQLRQKLIDIASGCYRGFANDKGVWVVHNYSLDDLYHRYTGKRLDKSTWRLRYGEMRDVPVEQWDPGARQYAIDDAAATRLVYDAQEALRPSLTREQGADPLVDEFRQARISFSRALMSTWGLKTDPHCVDELERNTHALFDDIEKELRAIHWIRTEFSKKDPTKRHKDDGTRDTAKVKEAMRFVWKQRGKPDGYLKTDSGDVSLSEEACAASEDEMLVKYATFGTQSTVIGKDVPMLRAGNTYPVHTRFGLAASGRRTSSAPNVQNPRRLAGVRECFRPRPGYVYAQADVEGLELCTLAQTCIWLLGDSYMAKAINGGKDLHTALACSILNIEYEVGAKRKKDKADKEFDNARQSAKVANFGFPGGLGITSMISFAKSTYGVVLTEVQTRELKDLWMRTWPEMNYYFQAINAMADGTGRITLKQHKSERIRGLINYTAACNTYFQGLGADAMGDAGFRLVKEQYTDPTSALFGSRTVNDVHDEFIVECVDDSTAHDVAKGVEMVIVDTLTEWIPDVRISAPPMLMRYWSKSAQATYDTNGRLIPWSAEAS